MPVSSYQNARRLVVLLMLTTILGPLLIGTPARAAITLPIKINFQNISAPVPTGYFRDYGQAYALRTGSNQGGNNYTYGWVTPGTNTPLDLSVDSGTPGNGRERNLISDQRYDTLMHMQADDITNFTNGVKAEGAWEIELPNAVYNVTVAVGDPQSNSPTESHTVRVEGTVAIANFASTGVNGEATRHRTRTVQVTVADGRLTLDAIGGFNTKINFVEIEAGSSLPRPKINGIIPANAAVGVRRDISVVAGVTPAQSDIDLNTINSSTVTLTRNSDNAPIPASVNTTAGGDSITLRPLDFLDPNTTYTFRVTSGVRDNSGQTMEPASSTFTTGTAGGPGSGGNGVAFEQIKNVASGNLFSSLAIGPDGKLYVASLDGYIVRYTINADGTLSGAQTINTVVTAEGGARAIIGLVFDPSSTAGDLRLWISHNGPYVQTNAPDWTGKIARLSGANLENFQNYVVNLPHSYKDHMNNSLAFGPDGRLYLNVGSNAAMGAPDTAWGQRAERLLTASVLQIDLAAIAVPPLDVKTEEGGTYNPFATNAPVKLFATGVRNAYDLVWHTNGQLYVPTNGSASGGNTPTVPNSLPSSCQNRIDKATNGNYTGPGVTGPTGVGQTQKDWLFRVVQGGYYGHPNPTRCEWVMNGGNPTAGAGNDGATEVPAYATGTQPDRNYRGTSYDFGLNKSPNGAIEYRSNVFAGVLTGQLMVVRYSGEDDIILLEPGGVNKDIINVSEKLPGLTGFNNPLDLVENRLNGNLYVIEFGPPSQITLLKPLVGSIPTIATSPEQTIFTDVQGGGASASQTITIRNDGTAPLNISNIQIIGAQAGQFQIVGPAPTTVPATSSATLQVAFNPAAAGPHLALLRITSNAANGAITEIVLRGLGTLGNGGGNEPSLQWILDTYEYRVAVGDPNPANNDLPTTNPLGEEVALQKFERADNANPVIIEPLAIFGPTSNNPVTRFGWYPSGNAAVKNELFSVSNAPGSNGQRIDPLLNAGATLSFDPGTNSFGFYSIWPAFGSREVFSEDALNTFGGSIPHHVRVYPLKDSAGIVVPNAYVVATEETTSGFDYQDVVVVVRNVRPFGSGNAGVPPSAPGNVTAAAGDTQVTLTWVAGPGTVPASYKVFRSTTTPVNTAVAPIATVNQTTYTDIGLNNGTTYHYAVVAVSAASQDSPASTEASATPFRPGGTIMIENLDRLPYNDRLVFNRLHGTGVNSHRLVTLRISNIGSTTLNVSQLNITGPDARYFTITSNRGPFAIAPADHRDVVFCMVIVGTNCSEFENGVPMKGLRFASVTINSSDPAKPAIPVTLAGSEQPGGGGDDEPDYQSVLDVFGYKVNTRFPNEGLTLKGPDPRGTRNALGDEVISDFWVRASDKAPVYVRQLVSLQGAGSPAFRLQGGGCGAANCQISIFGQDWQSFLPQANVATPPRPPAEMSVNPTGQFEIIAAGFSSRLTMPQTRPHGLRIYPMRDRDGVLVQNAYIVGQDYIGNTYPVPTNSSANFDYQDNIYLITNVRPATLTADPTHPGAFPGAPNLVLEFDNANYPNTLTDRDGEQSGFVTTLRNEIDNKSPQNPPSASYNNAALNLNTAGQGTLTVTTAAGSISGSDNTQVNSLCTPFDARTAKFVMSTRLLGPLPFNRSLHQGGITFGWSQDHYVKLVAGVFSGTVPAIQFAQELNGAAPATIGSNISLAGQTITTLDLQLTADPATGVIEAAYSVNGAAFIALPSRVTLSGVNQERFFDRNARGCLFTSHKNTTPVDVVFDRFAITAAPELTAPRNVFKRYNIGGPTVTVNGNTWTTDAGTFTPATAPNEAPGTFPIANTSDDRIYQDYRGNVGGATLQASRIITYELPIGTLEPTTVAVRLHFAEMFWGRTPGGGAAGPGRRIFDTTIEGVSVLPDFDISGASGGATTAIVVPIENIQVNDGNLTIVQRADVDFASLGAVEIVEQPDGSPVVNAGADQEVPVNALVTLSGTVVSNDISPLTYIWEQIGGAPVILNASGQTATFTAPNGYAELEFRLSVTNGLGKTGADTVTVIVGDEPITGLSVTSNAPKAINQTVNFTATIATGENAIYTWDFGDGSAPVVGNATIAKIYTLPGSYQVTVTASNSTSSANTSTTVTILPFPPYALRINAGGPTFTSPTTGKVWTANNNNTTALQCFDAASRILATTNGFNVRNTTDDTLFKTNRFSATSGVSNKKMTCNIAVPADGQYIVNLLFAEVFFGTTGSSQAGVDPRNKRVFDVAIEGVTLLDNFDIAQQAFNEFNDPVTRGAMTAITRTFTVNVSGQLNIAFNPTIDVNTKDNPQVNAVEVIRVLNFPPTVNAGVDQNVQPNTLTTLAGTVSDPEGAEVTYTWSQQPGSPAVTLNNASTLTPSFTPTSKGTYIFKLAATDAQGATSSDFVNIVVPNRAPTVSTSAAPSPTEVGNTVTLTAVVSDPDGDNLTYLWQQITGPQPVTINNSTNPIASFASALKGTYTFRVTVDDGDMGGIAQSTVSVVVNNRPPTTSPSATPSPAEVNDTVTLAANASDLDGDDLTYVWQQIGGPLSVELSNPADATPTFVPAVKGTYSFQVEVNDGDGGVITGNISVVVNNRAPIADAGANLSANVGEVVQLNGLGSSDPDGDNLTYAWTQTAGEPVTLANADTATPTFTAPGQPTNLQFELIVTDSEDVSSSADIVTVSIGEIAITGLNVTTSAPTVLGQTTSFTATLMTGSNVSYVWNFGDGTTANGATTSHIYAATGTYTVTLEATNSTGTVVVQELVTVTNEQPIAEAGNLQTVTVSAVVTLDGTASTDLDGHTPLTYGWEQTGGPAVTLDNASSATPTFTAPATAAVLAFRLVVTDTFGLASEPDSILVIVNDLVPGAVQAFNDGPTALGSPTVLEAVASGTNLTYTWDFGDGQVGTGEVVTHTYLLEGSYIAVVSVTNTTGQVDIAMTGVIVANEPPVADAGFDADAPVSTAVALDASMSFDPEGHNPLTFVWQQIGGTPVVLSNSASAVAGFTAPEQTGVLIFRVTVTDSYGKRSSDVTRINVVDTTLSGLAPTSSTPTVLGQMTSFTASVATGTNVTYAWDFGDGQVGIGPNVQHRYAAEGNYVVSVTASNGLNSVSTSLTVAVINTAPIANAGDDLEVSAGTIVTLSGSGSDPDGHNPLSFRWQQVSGSPVLAATNSPVTTFVAPTNNAVVLVFELVVTDIYGKSSSDLVEVRVEGDRPEVVYKLMLPLLFNQLGSTGPSEPPPPPAAPADLVVTRFEATPNAPGPDQPVLITAEVKNQGSQATGPFWVDLYINPNRAPTAAGRQWELTCTLDPCYGIAWFVQAGLEPGQSLVLTSTPTSYFADNTIWPGNFAPGTNKIYVYVDSWKPGAVNGAVTESNETNNRAEIQFAPSTTLATPPAQVNSTGPVLPERTIQ